MRLAMRLGLPYKRGGLWTPAKLAPLGAYWWRADRGVSLREAGPDWPSQGSHVRGLDFDGSTNYVDLGDTPLYDDTAIAASYTFLAYVDASEQPAANNYMYSEGNSGSATAFLGLTVRNIAGQMYIVVRDDTGTDTIDSAVSSALTDESWNAITLVLGASGWGLVVNGNEVQALGTAYTNTPSTTTFNRATIGALGRNTYSTHFEGPVAYGMRHDSALTLAQCRQVHQYIADAVAADGITLTIAGSETGNANSPLNHWPMNEDAAGAEVADSAGSVTGVRVPGDRVTNWLDRLQGLSFTQATTSLQPQFLSGDESFGGRRSLRFASEYLGASPVTLDALTWLFVLRDRTTGTPFAWIMRWPSGPGNRGLYVNGGRIEYNLNSLNNYGSGSQALIRGAGHTLIFVRGSGGAASGYVDGGTDRSTGSAGTGTVTDLRLGESWTSEIAEVVAVGGEVDAATLNQWLAYVERHYGLTYTEI